MFRDVLMLAIHYGPPISESGSVKKHHGTFFSEELHEGLMLKCYTPGAPTETWRA